jgi:hypothetical protein
MKRPIAWILPFVLTVPLSAAEEDSAPSTEQTETVTTQAVKPELWAAVSDLPGLVQQDGGIYWADDSHRFPVVAAADDTFTVETALGPIPVARESLGQPRIISAFADRTRQAHEAGLNDEESAALVFEYSALTGPRLKSSELLVLRSGVLRRDDPPRQDRSQELNRLRDAVDSVQAALADSELDSLVQKVVSDLLEKLDGRDGQVEFDEVPPSYARQLLRHGWLKRVLPTVPAAEELQRLVMASESFQPILRFANQQASLELLRNATGSNTWLLREPTGVHCAVRPRSPEYAWDAQDILAESWVISRYPADSDPLIGEHEPRRIRLLVNNREAARWDAEDGFHSDILTWQELLPHRGRSLDNPLLFDYFPPHIVLTQADGDVQAIYTAHGRLDALRIPTPEAAEDFLAQAAAVLPDAGHLDLIGQYLLRYVYDSPDATMPFVPGTRTISSDIHQTAIQTLLSGVGGICRGDCDDLSELYHNILERQQKLPYVISLPAHAACAWAEEKDDGWHTFVLQTGRALEFVAKRLPDSLVSAYKFFGKDDTVDPNGLGLLLRFSGENTRSSWRLSWRIFAEPEYAETMIDVQRDWHFQTYARAIDKMERLIGAGDHDNANYRELAGLYNFTGQYPLAAEYQSYARDITAEPDSRLFMTTEIIGHWAKAGNAEQANRELDRLLNEQLPQLGEELGGTKVQVGLELLGTLVTNELTEASGRIVDEVLEDVLDQQADRVITWAKGSFDRELWQTNDFLRQVRFWLRWYVRLAVDVLDQRGLTALHEDPGLFRLASLTQRWMRHLASLDGDDPSDFAAIFAIIGDYYKAVIGEEALLAELEAAPLPAADQQHDNQRLAPDLQRPADLPWIKASVPFWWNMMAESFLPGKQAPSPQRIRYLGQAAAAAYQSAIDTDLISARLHHQAHLAALVLALYQQDEAELRRLLLNVKTKNDKRLRDDTAQWLGDAAKGLELDWYRQVLAIWREELDYKPKYYWIAWRAMLNDAPEHALLVAEMAAKRFADDPAFIEELQLLRELANPEGRQRREAEARELLSRAPRPDNENNNSVDVPAEKDELEQEELLNTP